MEFLPKMTGKKITTDYRDPPDPTTYPRREWIVIKKLSEYPDQVTPEDVVRGMGPASIAGKYHCHLAENKNVLAFMRVYKQIPQAGTGPEDSSVRQAQATERPDHTELAALKHLTDNKCPTTPKLLGWHYDTQDARDLAPGGYVTYLVWEKVPGDPLSEEEFWSFTYDQRESIRDKFKHAYSFVAEYLDYNYVLTANQLN